MQDGISGYPAPPYDPTVASSFVLDHPASHDIRCLSTNAVYTEVLRCLAALAGPEEGCPYADQRAELVASIDGRHNAICWPMVMGLWGYAAAAVGDTRVFGQTLDDLVRLFRGSGDELCELYNATTGEVDGGWQVGRHWESLPHQTWSATAFLRLIHEGLFGLRFTPTRAVAPAGRAPGYGELALRSLPIGGPRWI